MINVVEGYESVKRIIDEAMEKFDKKLVFLSSFGAEDMVITHVIVSENLPIPIHTIDTGRLFQPTYDLIEKSMAKYGIQVRFFHPSSQDVERLISSKGPNSFYASVSNRHECCNIRKVEPLDRAISGFKAWITGVRGGQTGIRSAMTEIEPDPLHDDVFKVCPVLQWTLNDVMSYIHFYDVPYNTLHDRGFPSIGCEPCTRGIKPGEDERAGRWWWENGIKECGIHIAKNGHKENRGV